jgi:dephospho-CoA kinase
MAGIHEPSALRILGLTGPIACGKSTVGDLLLSLGAAERIDADDIVHELMMPGTSTTEAVANEFGKEMLTEAGSIDRQKLGLHVFGDQDRLRRLEAIVHPAVRHAVRDRLAKRSEKGEIVVLDAVRLLQSELLELCTTVWVVTCSRQVQLDRLLRNRHMPEQAARDRLAAQPSFDHPRVSRVIENSGNWEMLEQEVRGAWSDFRQAITAVE